MRNRIELVLMMAVAALVAGCASDTQQSSEVAASTQAASSVAAGASPGQPTRECRYAKATGTKMRTRICHPLETWAMLDAAAAKEQDTDAFFRRSRENSTAAGGVQAAPTGGGF